MEENNKIIYAPVIIPTLCRDEHFVRCIESLKKNSYAKYTEIYVAVDYPTKEIHWKGYKNICKYLNGNFSEFKALHVFKREKNYGSSKNMIEIRKVVLERHDRFIRTDDDAEFSPNFLEYMDKCLMEFENDDSVIAITGYSYPIVWDTSIKASLIKENFVCPMWGTGFWKNKFQQVESDINNNILYRNFDAYLRNESIKKNFIGKMTDAGFCDYIQGGLSINKEKSIMYLFTDVSLRVYMAMKGKYVIMPVISKVRNWGFDGTGLYCQKINQQKAGKYAYNYNYVKQVIDTKKNFDICVDTKNNNDENKNRMNSFDKKSKKILWKLKLQILLYKILGEKKYYNLVQYIKNRLR